MIRQLLILAFLLLVVPTIVGSLAANIETTARRGKRNLPLWWVSGQFLLWAGFQLICMPMVLAEKNFGSVVILFSVFTGVMVLFAAVAAIRHRAKGMFFVRVVEKEAGQRDFVAVFLWVSVAALLALQLILAVLLAYEEGDDAFYVAVSVTTSDSDTMYLKLPYTGGATGIDARHGLAPFPIWVTYLSRLVGTHPAAMSQVVLPVVLIVMSYTIYYLLGERLFREKRKQALFMLLVEVLVLFGGYSLQSAENFLLVRTAQGKAVLADIVIPFLFLLLLGILEELQHGRKTGVWQWGMVAVAMIAGCLCSTEGTLLMCALLGVVGLCMATAYRRYKLLLPMAGCGIVPVGVAFLHFLLK